MGKFVLGVLVGFVATSLTLLALLDDSEPEPAHAEPETPQRSNSDFTLPIIVEPLRESVEQENAAEPDLVTGVEEFTTAYPYDPDGPARHSDGSLNVPRIPALPGMAGYDVLLPPPIPVNPVEQIATHLINSIGVSSNDTWWGSRRDGTSFIAIYIQPDR